MRAFAVLASLVVLASADVKHLYGAPYNNQASNQNGYSYNEPIVNFVPTGSNTQQNYIKPNIVTVDRYPTSSGSFIQSAPLIQQTPTTYVQPQQQQQVFFGGQGSYPVNNGFSQVSSGSGNRYVNSGFGGLNGGANSGFGGNFQEGNQNYARTFGRTNLIKQIAPIVTKSSYVFGAPEDKEEIQQDQNIVLPRPRKHYNVVFIKAPASTIINSPSAAVGGQTQEKTLIYVLSDKKRIENRIEVPEVDQAKLQKPEVFFIKYNQPTQVVNSKVQYQTVESVNGAENGAVNGVANKVSGNGALFDEGSNPEQAQIAQTIYQAVQTGGLDGGLKTLEQLVSAGHSIGHNAGQSFGNGGQYDTVNVNQQNDKYYTGLAPTDNYAPGQHTSYNTGSAQQTVYTQQQSAPVNYNNAASGSSYTEKGYNY